MYYDAVQKSSGFANEFGDKNQQKRSRAKSNRNLRTVGLLKVMEDLPSDVEEIQPGNDVYDIGVCLCLRRVFRKRDRRTVQNGYPVHVDIERK